MAATVLVVDDDDTIRTSLRLLLEDEGHRIEEAPTGEHALERFQHTQPDIVLIDVMLPGIDGFELCRQIRKVSEVPVLMLTARGDSHDVVAGLEAGADDYVVKPAVPKELGARVRALLRRTRFSETSAETMVFGDLQITPDAGEVRRNGVEVNLTSTEFKLLCELAGDAGRVLSRESLLERVWGYDYFGDSRLVDVHIRRLRAKIEADPSEPRWVVTMRGLGYKFEP